MGGKNINYIILIAVLRKIIRSLLNVQDSTLVYLYVGT